MSADWSTPLRRIVTDGDDEDLAYAIGALEEVVRLMLGDLRASGRPHLAQRHARTLVAALSDAAPCRADPAPGPAPR